MSNTKYVLIFCLAASVLLLAVCGGEEEPAPVDPTATTVPVADEPTPAGEPDAPATLVHEFAEGTEIVNLDQAGLPRNPTVVETDGQFKWAALVSRDGETMWVVDGETTSVGPGAISDFVTSADLSRHAYVSDNVVVVDGEQVDQGTTSCCPTFSQDSFTFGYISDGSIVVLDGVPQEGIGDAVEQLVLSADGSRHAYIVGGDTLVLDGEKQKAYDRVSSPTFSPDGSSFAYIANDSVLVVDGEENEIKETTEVQITFSPDGSRLAYVTGERKFGNVVLDDQELQRYTFGCPTAFLRWSCLAFTSDGSSLAYTTLVMGPSFGGESAGLTYRVVQDGAQQGHFVGCCLIARPDSAQMAYVSSRFLVVVDGQQVESVASSYSTAPLTFSYSDRQHLSGWLIPADLVFGADGNTVGFLLYETDVSPTSIIKLFLEILDVP